MNIQSQEWLKPLEEQFQNSELKYEDFEKCFYELKNAQNQLQNMLEHASEIKRDEKRFKELYRRLAGKNASELIEKLARLRFALKKDKEKDKDLEKAFEGSGYRLLEQTRAGRKDDVYYGILRIFVANNRKFPDDLIEVFKPIYSEEMFKVFIFSFLSGIIGKTDYSEKTKEGE